MIILVIIVRTLIFSALIWGSIKLVDPDNTRNSWTTALFIALIFSLFGSVLGGLMMIFPFVAYFLILVKYYDLGLAQAAVSVVIMFAISFAIGWLASLMLPDRSSELEDASRRIEIYLNTYFA